MNIEVKGWINELAEIAQTEYGIAVGKISFWVAEETGYAVATVRRYLQDKYKNMEQALRGGKTERSTPSVLKQAKSKLTPNEFDAVKEAAKEELTSQVIADVRY